MSIKLTPERCKACAYCIASCPREAISLLKTTNAQGYQITTVDEERCIECGSCYTVCPDYVYEIKRK